MISFVASWFVPYLPVLHSRMVDGQEPLARRHRRKPICYAHGCCSAQLEVHHPPNLKKTSLNEAAHRAELRAGGFCGLRAAGFYYLRFRTHRVVRSSYQGGIEETDFRTWAKVAEEDLIIRALPGDVSRCSVVKHLLCWLLGLLRKSACGPRRQLGLSF